MFNEFLTTEGERLLAKSIAGTATITFTKMELGDGDRGTASKNITSLESKRMTLDIYSVQLSGDNHITITSMLKSENIGEGFYFREKAVYATDGTTEILFMYGTAGSLAEWIENSQISVFERTIRTIIAFSEGDNISVTIQGGAYASGEDAKNILTAIQNIKLDGDWAKYEQAESILSLLDTLCTAYTALRAGKLDNLDALISSRAPANTALSNAVWTDVRAAKLDNLDAKISSRAVASTALSNATWTNARAALLDNLDSKISSRAPASTALSTATWTNARAGYIDNIVNSEHGLPTVAHYAYKSMLNTGETTDVNGGINTGTVMAKLNALITTLSAGTAKVSCIKKIIRGTAYLSDRNSYAESYTFNESINVDKSLVFITGLGHNTYDHQAWATAVHYDLSSTEIELYVSSEENVSADYQIVEFY